MAAHTTEWRARDDRETTAHGISRCLSGSRTRGAGTIAKEREAVASDAFGGPSTLRFRETQRKFFVNYFKTVSVVFGAAWVAGNQHKSATALRAFIRWRRLVDGSIRSRRAGSDFRANPVSRAVGRRIGNLRFESEGVWKRAGTTVDSLARELKLALEYPEGAGV